MIANITDKANPTTYWSGLLGDDLDDIAPLDKDENILFCSAGFAGLIIVNVTDKSNPPVILSKLIING